MRWRGPLAGLSIAATAIVGVAVAAPAPRTLPLEGKTASGQEWRLKAGPLEEDRDVGSDRCLTLEYTTDYVTDDTKYTGGMSACGAWRPRRVAGYAVVDCEGRSVFVFGIARERVSGLWLRNGRGLHRAADFAQPPPDVGFRSRSFIGVIRVNDLPVRLAARGADQRTILRIPHRTEICRPHPAGSTGGDPTIEFASRK